MFPLSQDGYDVWEESSIEDIRNALRKKSLITMKNVQPGLRRRYDVEEVMGEEGYEGQSRGRGCTS